MVRGLFVNTRDLTRENSSFTNDPALTNPTPPSTHLVGIARVDVHLDRHCPVAGVPPEAEELDRWPAAAAAAAARLAVLLRGLYSMPNSPALASSYSSFDISPARTLPMGGERRRLSRRPRLGGGRRVGSGGKPAQLPSTHRRR